eukprot:3632603-Amphidinium_carterae.1
MPRQEELFWYPSSDSCRLGGLGSACVARKRWMLEASIDPGWDWVGDSLPSAGICVCTISGEVMSIHFITLQTEATKGH